ICIKASDGTLLARLYPDAVTPTMLAFRMPFDCFAPLMLEVAKVDQSGNLVTATIPLCDPKGCAETPAGSPCDDGNACTADDHCDGNRNCVSGARDELPGTPCDDGNACTVDDRCDGNGDCVGGAALACEGPCLTCDPCSGCEPKPAGSECRQAAGPCDVEETCTGTSADCPANGFM